MPAPAIPCAISDLFPVARSVGLTTEAMTGRVPCAELLVVLYLSCGRWLEFLALKLAEILPWQLTMVHG